MDTTKDYYAILGVLPTAEDIVIRAAYKALVQRFHPDRFIGSKDEANARMTELNEAYSVLSDPRRRRDYDAQHKPGAYDGNAYFDDGEGDIPPDSDPLSTDWSIALRYYPDLKELEANLSQISWRLVNTYRAYLIQEKQFDDRVRIANEMEDKFLELYFGTNLKLLAFARELIADGIKPAAKALNDAVRVLGNSIDADRVIMQIRKEFVDFYVDESTLMKRLGITFDGEYYHYRNYRYSSLKDAISYAKWQRQKART